jgi:membrane protein required for colicin V production
MLWIDYAIVGLVCLGLAAGAITGLSLQVFSLLCWIVASAVGFGFSHELAFFLKPSVTDPAARLAAAFVLLNLLTVFLGIVISLLLGGWLKHRQLTLFDRLGGLILGAVHGGVWVTLIVILAGLSVLPHSPWWQKAQLLSPFQAIALWLHEHFPADVLENIRYH